MRRIKGLLLSSLLLGVFGIVSNADAEVIYRYKQGLVTSTSPTGGGSGTDTGSGGSGSGGTGTSGGANSGGAVDTSPETAIACGAEQATDNVSCAVGPNAPSTSGAPPITVTGYSPPSYNSAFLVTRCFHIGGGFGNFVLYAENIDWLYGRAMMFSNMYFVPYLSLAGNAAYADIGHAEQAFFPDATTHKATHDRDMCLIMVPKDNLTTSDFPVGSEREPVWLSIVDMDDKYIGADDVGSDDAVPDSQWTYTLSVDGAGFIHPDLADGL